MIAAAIFAADRASKFWVVEVIDLQNRLFVPVRDPWLNLSMAWNQGINFGLFDMGLGGRWLLIGIAVAIVVGLGVWVRRTRGWSQALGVGAVIGGALGNVWDRVQYGAVADFLNVGCCGIRNPFAFNIADAAIFAGAALLILSPRDTGSEKTGADETPRKGT